jgi:hypothetical protein
MEISEFTFRLLIIGMPGILCYFLLGRLIRWREKDTALTIMCIFLLGGISYLLYSVYHAYLAYCYGLPITLTPVQTVFSIKAEISGVHILGASITSFYLSLLLSFIHKKKLFNQVAQVMLVTNRYGDEDVWDHFHNSPFSERNDGWMYFRDYKKDLLYYGFLSTWSETEELREVVLLQADVFKNDTGEYLYSADKIYLARQPDDLSVEVEIKHKKPENEQRQATDPAIEVSSTAAPVN